MTTLDIVGYIISGILSLVFIGLLFYACYLEYKAAKKARAEVTQFRIMLLAVLDCIHDEVSESSLTLTKLEDMMERMVDQYDTE